MPHQIGEKRDEKISKLVVIHFHLFKVWGALPVYASVLLALSAAVFILLVKNIKASKLANAKGLEALDAED